MYKSQFYITEGQVWHFGNITEPGQYEDFFLPLRVNDAELFADLKEERSELLGQLGNDNLTVTDAPFKLEAGKLLLRLKWKPKNVEEGEVVILDQDGKPLTCENTTLQDARFKLSFSQFVWEYKGKCGTKLQPRKIQLLSYATVDDVFKEEPQAVVGDF